MPIIQNNATECKLKLAKHKGIIICFILWGLVSLHEIFWVTKNTYPQYWDAAVHFIDSIKMFNAVSSGLSAYPKIILDSAYYPPLVALTGVPFYYLFGLSINVGTIGMNCLFLGILIFSVYGIGKNIQDVNTGILASFIVISFPIIGLWSKFFMLDVALVSMVSLSLYFLLKAEQFENSKYSILWGISFGLGMLTKWTFIFFIVGPFIYLIIVSYYESRLNLAKLKNRSKNFLIAIIIGGVLSSIWYIPHINIILELSKHAGMASGGPNYFIFSVWMASLYFCLLFLIMTFFLIYWKKIDSKIILLLLSIIIPFIILSIQPNRDSRYLAPILPAMALIISLGLFSIKNPRLKTLLISVSIFAALALFISSQYGVASIVPFNVESSLNTPIKVGQIFTIITVSPDTSDWKEKEIYGFLSNELDNNSAVICVIPEIPVVIGPLSYNAYAHNWSLWIQEGCYAPYAFYNCGYVITLKDRKGEWGPDDSRNLAKKAQYSQDLFEAYDDVTLVKTISLPDDEELLFYKKRWEQTDIAKITHKFEIAYSDKIQFLGYDLTKVEVDEKRELELLGRITNTSKITYYWKCIQPMDKDYMIFVHFTDSNGKIIFQQDHNPIYGLYPTTTWIPGNIYQESYFITPPFHIPNGTYSIGIGIYSKSGDKLIPDIGNKDPFDPNRIIIGNYTVNNVQNEMYKKLPDYVKA